MAELISGMFTATRYKRSQGRIARQLTFAAMAMVVVLGAAKINAVAVDDIGTYFVPLAVTLVGLWAAFRIVNLPKFADFLIAVEAEMNKVSWPSRAEAWRASVVVIVVIFFLAALLFMYDLVLDKVLNSLFGL